MEKNKYKNFKFCFSFLLSLYLIIGAFVLPVSAFAKYDTLPQIIKGDGKDYVDGEILVKYKDNKINLNTSSGLTKSLDFVSSNSLEKKEDLVRNNISILKIKDAKTVEEKISELNTDPNVLYAEPNYKRYESEINTNDTYKDLLWGLDNTGQSVNGVSGTAGADIEASKAWAINEGTTAPVTVAVIDVGVAYNHPDLAINMWDGTNCKDNLGNPLGGCIHGYDFENNDTDPLPSNNSHGTHVSGIIAAVKNNNKGVIGVAPNAKIMSIRFDLTVEEEVKAIDFAIQNGAKIINASYGGSSFSQTEYDAINLFKQSGGIFVAAAGNDSSSNDSSPVYPSSYNLDNIISVAATDSSDNLASFSNYGATTVDVGAPGTNILSTMSDDNGGLNETYGYGSGTSMSTPYVSGLAALIWGTNPNLTATQVKDTILNTGDSESSLNGKTVTGKRIDAFNALTSITRPNATITYSNVNKIVKKGDSLVITAQFNEPIADSPTMKITISGANSVDGADMTKVSDTEYTYTYTVGSGDGVATVTLSNGTNINGGLIIPDPISGSTFTIDNTAPIISSSPHLSLFTNKGPINYNISYDGASSITLSNSDVTLNTTGTATGTISVTGTGNLSRTITISDISGNGTLGISIASNTASDIAGNNAPAFSPSEIFSVGNVVPTNQDTVFSNSITKKGGDTVSIISSGDVNNNIWFAPSDTTTFIESTKITKASNGTSTSITAPSIEGDYKLFVIDKFGNISAGSLATLTIDNTPPALPVITSVSGDNQITYDEKGSIDVSGTADANSLITVTLSDGTDTKTGTQQLINGATSYSVILDGTSASPSALKDGTINVSVTATDMVGNISSVAHMNVSQYPQVVISSGGGGGGGGGSYYAPPVVTPVVTKTPTIIVTTPSTDCGTTGSSINSITGVKCDGLSNSNPLLDSKTVLPTKDQPKIPTFIFLKTLKKGVTNNDVKELQKFLNSKGFLIAKVGLGSPSHETNFFGPATRQALIQFQKFNKLTPDGILGPMTRKIINGK